MTSIRETDEERDVEEILELWREAFPVDVINREAWLHYGRAMPATARLGDWVAEDEGCVVGSGYAFLSFFGDEGTAHCRVLVGSSHRRRGIGRALFGRVEAHAHAIGATRLLASFDESPAGVAFATALGFTEARAERSAVLDPRSVRTAPPAGVDLRPLRIVDPRLAHAIDLEASRDMPSVEAIDDMPYDDWERFVLGHPLLTLDGSFLAFVEDEPAALSLVTADPASGRASSMFTGTRRAFRGRGLGLAVKLASIAWANEQGVTQLATRNDESNAPMLAINRRLGYVPATRRVEWVREEMASSRVRRAPAT
jgi:GNAT superfamily N-acetyltransferase